MDIDSKQFQKLCNAIFQQQFEKDESITDELILESILTEESGDFLSHVKRLLREAGRRNWNLSEAEKFVSEDTVLSEELQAAFVQWWRAKRSAVSEAVRSTVNWSSRLDHFAWRVDMNNAASSAPTSTGIVELTVSKAPPNNDQQDTLRFEMDQEAVNNMITQMQAIEKTLNVDN